jgi:transposase
MAKPLISDALWSRVRPLLPRWRARPKGGRPPIDDRAVLTGIVFVLRSGIAWEMLPREMGCGSGMTCWRRLRDWHEAGVWHALHHLLLEELAEAERIDWSRAAIDSAAVSAKKGAPKPVPTQPTEAGPAPSTTSWSTATARRLPCA